MIENWDQYKDLEYYPDRVCGCTCGGRIKVKPHHKWYGIPEYIHGHHRRGSDGWNSGLTKETSKSVARAAEKNTGKTAWNKDLTKETDLRVAKYADKNRGKKRTPEQNKRSSEVRKNKPRSEKTKKKIGNTLRGRKYSEEQIENQRIRTKELWEDPIYRENHIKGIRKSWEVEIDRDRRIKAVINAANKKPNKTEKKLDKLLNKLVPKEYQLNVNVEVMLLAGKCPDFVNVNGQKKVIELFGDYWHSEEVTGIPVEQHIQERAGLFSQYGYQTLIIWEHELENIDLVSQKILEFNGKDSL